MFPQCERCSDATELKTFSSAMICPKCKKVKIFIFSRSDATSTDYFDGIILNKFNNMLNGLTNTNML